jgi:hypothetical protein
MATGSGRTLGAALVDLFAQGGRPGGERGSYTRTGWRAQFAQLSGTRTGHAALERAGLSATTRTQRGWLSGDVAASRANQGLIAQAYKAMAGGWNPRWETAVFKISGRVTQGRDSRIRGFGRHSPLRIEGDVPGARWTPIEREYDGDADTGTIEELFIQHVVIPNLGEGSEPWEFDGDRYEVTA